MRFQFRLQKIAEYIEKKEFSKKLEVAKASQAVKVTESQIQALVEENEKLLKEQSAKLDSGIEWVVLYMDRIDRNALSINGLDRKKQAELKFLEIKIQEWKELSVRKKALDSLKEKKEKEFRLKAERINQKQLDEVYQLLQAGKR